MPDMPESEGCRYSGFWWSPDFEEIKNSEKEFQRDIMVFRISEFLFIERFLESVKFSHA